MRFRVAHLLALMVYVAIFGMALATPTELVASAVAFTSWIVYAGLGWWGFAHPKNRFVFCSSLIFGVSYLAMGLYYWGRLLLPSFVSERVLARLLGEDPYGYRVSILDFGWSFLFALIGGALGAYFSKPKSKD